MAAPFDLGNETLVLHVQTQSGTDKYGVAQHTDTPVTVTGCCMGVTSSEETDNRVNPQQMRGKALLPATTPTLFPAGATWANVHTLDWQGISFRLWGPVRPETGIDGTVDHFEVTCHYYQG